MNYKFSVAGAWEAYDSSQSPNIKIRQENVQKYLDKISGLYFKNQKNLDVLIYNKISIRVSFIWNEVNYFYFQSGDDDYFEMIVSEDICEEKFKQFICNIQKYIKVSLLK